MLDQEGSLVSGIYHKYWLLHRIKYQIFAKSVT
jgi:hypothetical protein